MEKTYHQLYQEARVAAINEQNPERPRKKSEKKIERSTLGILIADHGNKKGSLIFKLGKQWFLNSAS